ncbi:fatty-acid amide hydrolase [Fusarium sporotrichioides]|uniref:Fatty-acid amide hydrolase n=1 Tax=Fusarium sporotrichioides TaxID=5514 RepID=A0A395RXH0_FUSSP|nr:fatty-acid amide hydrolase [Fusarium sporotrichioides]
MTRILRVDDKEECGADKQYYECSYFDFKYIGCCSHDPCIKPRGCHDDPVTSDPSSWLSSDMPDTTTHERTTTGDGNMGISVSWLFSTDTSDTQTTLETRRRPSVSITMSEDEESSSLASRTVSPTTMTDSGTTRTVSNSHRVTVTNKKTIYTSLGPPTPSGFLTSVTSAGTDQLPFPTGSFESTSVSLPTETGTPGASLEENGSNTGSPSIGLVVGAAVGGIAFLGLIVGIVICIRRRRAKNIEFPNTPYYLEEKGEKSYLSRMLSRKSTRRSQDPFAPFGGRIDRVDNHLQPPSGTFEMDGADNVVHELPAVTYDDGNEKESQLGNHAAANSTTGHTAVSGYSAQTAYPTATGSCIDPRANLNATLEDRQQKQFVNHWNQYRALGENVNQRQQG